jgi:hypothetical protein
MYNGNMRFARLTAVCALGTAALASACARVPKIPRLWAAGLVGTDGRLAPVSAVDRGLAGSGQRLSLSLDRAYLRDLPAFAPQEPLSIVGIGARGLEPRSLLFVLGARSRLGEAQAIGLAGDSPRFVGFAPAGAVRLQVVVSSLDGDPRVQAHFRRALQRSPPPREVRPGGNWKGHQELAAATVWFPCPKGYHRSIAYSVHLGGLGEDAAPLRPGRLVLLFRMVPSPWHVPPQSAPEPAPQPPWDRLRVVGDDLQWVQDGSRYEGSSYLLVTVESSRATNDRGP